ncbi:MAG TPA: sigma-70 family RNA polymerase sigma factor [Myxococcaceae bacterium]|jgi:RNA polymerase sigma-70 factor (ECF subfamily)|nr:sigma-70 family RNA polymerase sigma factor [Myxococcaceae bacterium]
MARTDAELIAAARQGEGPALDELLARHEKQVFRFGLRMCGSEEDARDVLQETLLAAVRGLPEFRGQADLSTWLYQIARSFCIKARRRRVGEPADKVALHEREVQEVPSEEATVDARVHAREIGDVLQTAILSLPESYREVIVLKHVEGLTAEEVAGVLHQDVAAVKSRLHRARAGLRDAVSTLLGQEAWTRETEPCPELADELSSYAAGDIDQATCAQIEQHLARCPRCAGACQTLQRTVSLCRRIPGDAVPAPVRTAVRRALGEALRA